jgi:hypothetical protein
MAILAWRHSEIRIQRYPFVAGNSLSFIGQVHATGGVLSFDNEQKGVLAADSLYFTRNAQLPVARNVLVLGQYPLMGPSGIEVVFQARFASFPRYSCG